MCSISESISIESGVNHLGISNFEEFSAMFHSNLRHFSFAGGEFGLDSVTRTVDSVKNGTTVVNVENLEEIKINIDSDNPDIVGSSSDNIKSIFDTIDFFDKLEMRKNVKRYTICWDSQYEEDEIDGLFNRIYYSYDKHPLLEKITFEIIDNIDLKLLLSYFKENRKLMFVEREMACNLKHFKTIELEFGFGGDMSVPRKMRLVQKNSAVVTQKYSVKEMVIHIGNVNQHIDNIYDNICDWIQRIDKSKQKMDGRRIVLNVV